jgi:hypothetical protein
MQEFRDFGLHKCVTRDVSQRVPCHHKLPRTDFWPGMLRDGTPAAGLARAITLGTKCATGRQLVLGGVLPLCVAILTKIRKLTVRGKQTKLQWYEGIACSSLTADLTRTLVCVTSERNLSC